MDLFSNLPKPLEHSLPARPPFSLTPLSYTTYGAAAPPGTTQPTAGILPLPPPPGLGLPSLTPMSLAQVAPRPASVVPQPVSKQTKKKKLPLSEWPKPDLQRRQEAIDMTVRALQPSLDSSYPTFKHLKNAVLELHKANLQVPKIPSSKSENDMRSDIVHQTAAFLASKNIINIDASEQQLPAGRLESSAGPMNIKVEEGSHRRPVDLVSSSPEPGRASRTVSLAPRPALPPITGPAAPDAPPGPVFVRLEPCEQKSLSSLGDRRGWVAVFKDKSTVRCLHNHIEVDALLVLSGANDVKGSSVWERVKASNDCIFVDGKSQSMYDSYSPCTKLIVSECWLEAAAARQVALEHKVLPSLTRLLFISHNFNDYLPEVRYKCLSCMALSFDTRIKFINHSKRCQGGYDPIFCLCGAAAPDEAAYLGHTSVCGLFKRFEGDFAARNA
ncbi:hypothetical protein H2200_013491 [Cladophialophora chaetospira]|uniref:Uncharacterized protein n=1 Tax=Cladophialophora chaetospira TaxID=386627 RepID=A0AA38WPW9_9EURO|nr:hypothetical protein H2200_013491 [Cladophialophora chaetospira]